MARLVGGTVRLAAGADVEGHEPEGRGGILPAAFLALLAHGDKDRVAAVGLDGDGPVPGYGRPVGQDVHGEGPVLVAPGRRHADPFGGGLDGPHAAAFHFHRRGKALSSCFQRGKGAPAGIFQPAVGHLLLQAPFSAGEEGRQEEEDDSQSLTVHRQSR